MSWNYLSSFFLCNIFYCSEKFFFKHVSKKIYAVAKEICFVKTGSLYLHWKNYTDTVGDQHIYGIKVDIKDAFGMINIGKVT